jgi:hypothetical protein
VSRDGPVLGVALGRVEVAGPVLAGPAGEAVGTRAAGEPVGTAAAVQGVVSLAAGQGGASEQITRSSLVLTSRASAGDKPA